MKGMGTEMGREVGDFEMGWMFSWIDRFLWLSAELLLQ